MHSVTKLDTTKTVELIAKMVSASRSSTERLCKPLITSSHQKPVDMSRNAGLSLVERIAPQSESSHTVGSVIRQDAQSLSRRELKAICMAAIQKASQNLDLKTLRELFDGSLSSDAMRDMECLLALQLVMTGNLSSDELDASMAKSLFVNIGYLINYHSITDTEKLRLLKAARHVLESQSGKVPMSVLTAYSRIGHVTSFAECRNLFDVVASVGLTPNQAIYTNIIANMDTGNAQQLLEHALTDKNIDPSRLLSSFVQAKLNKASVYEAFSVFLAYPHRKEAYNEKTIPLLLYASASHIEDFVAMVREMAGCNYKPGSHHVYTMIRNLCDGRHVDEAVTTLKLFGSNDQTVYSQRTIQAIVDAFKRRQTIEEAMKFLFGLQVGGVAVSPKVMGRVTFSLLKKKRYSDAEAWANRLKNSPTYHNVVVHSFNLILKEYAVRRTMREVERVFDEMKALRVASQATSCYILIAAHLRRSQIKAANALVDWMKAEGVPITSNIYSRFMHLWTQRGQWDKVKELWDHVRREGMPMSDECLSVYMCALHSQGKFRECRMLFNEFQVNINNYPSTFRELLHGLSKTKRFDEVEALVSNLVDNGKLRDSTLAFLIGILASRYGVEKAESQLRLSLSKCRVDDRPYARLIKHSMQLPNGMEFAKKYWEIMRQLNMRRSKMTYLTMIGACLEFNDVASAVQLFMELSVKTKFRAHDLLFFLTWLYGESGYSTSLKQFYEIISKKVSVYNSLRGVEQNSSAYVTKELMVFYILNGKYSKADALWKRMWRGNTGTNPIRGITTTIDADEEVGYTENQVEDAFGVNKKTVQFYMDVLGYSKRLSELERLYETLKKAEFPFNGGVYVGYMEALARCGEYKKAMRIPMGFMQYEGWNPSVYTFARLIKILGVESKESRAVFAYVDRFYPRHRVLRQIARPTSFANPINSKKSEYVGSMSRGLTMKPNEKLLRKYGST